MTRFSGTIDVGDVLVTREKGWPWSDLIRLGEAFAHTPALCNHVIIAHHMDEQGTFWGIEGRPGGVGWRDLSEPLGWPLTNANNAQPKTREQRLEIAVCCEALLGTPYDWAGIAEDTRNALTGFWGGHWAPQIAGEWSDGQTPAHVVCSSLADFAYEKVGLLNPGGTRRTRMTTPGDWDKFCIKQEWTGRTG
jgi:hypothetical protein